MSRHGITVTVLATGLSDAITKDEQPGAGGHDMAAGLFGPAVSAWVREVAAELQPLPTRSPHDDGTEEVKAMFKRATGVDVNVRCHNGEFFVTDPDGQEFKTGLARKH